MHERPEPSVLVVGDLPPSSVREVANAQHEQVAERRSHDLDESPAVVGAHPQFEGCAHLLVLHTREREHGHLQIVGVDEVESVQPETVGQRDAEQPLRGPVRPQRRGHRVDDQDPVGETGGDRGEGADVRTRSHEVDACERLLRSHRLNLGSFAVRIDLCRLFGPLG